MSELAERPPIASAPLSVLLLVQDAEAYLEGVAGAWIASLDALGQDYELICIDDGSADQTAAVAEKLVSGHPRLRLLRHPIRRGPGAALRTGLEAACHPLVLYTVAGRQYRPADLGLFRQWIDKVDLVAGYRPRPCRTRPWKEALYRGFVRVIFGVRLRDVNCWYLLARRAIFRRIPLQANSSFAHAEILAKANFLGHLLTEVPVAYQPISGGEGWANRLGFRQTLAEASQVFSDPDFGPPFLPDDTRAPAC